MKDEFLRIFGPDVPFPDRTTRIVSAHRRAARTHAAAYLDGRIQAAAALPHASLALPGARVVPRLFADGSVLIRQAGEAGGDLPWIFQLARQDRLPVPVRGRAGVCAAPIRFRMRDASEAPVSLDPSSMAVRDLIESSWSRIADWRRDVMEDLRLLEPLLHAARPEVPRPRFLPYCRADGTRRARLEEWCRGLADLLFLAVGSRDPRIIRTEVSILSALRTHGGTGPVIRADILRDVAPEIRTLERIEPSAILADPARALPPMARHEAEGFEHRFDRRQAAIRVVPVTLARAEAVAAPSAHRRVILHRDFGALAA